MQWVAAVILFVTAIPGAVQFSRDVNVVIDTYITSTWYWNLILTALFRWVLIAPFTILVWRWLRSRSWFRPQSRPNGATP